MSRNSFHEIHNEAGLSSDVAPLLASHRLQLVRMCVRLRARARASEPSGAEKESLHLTLRSSLSALHPLKNTPKPLTGCGELRAGPRVFRRTGGPPPLALPSAPHSGLVQPWRSYHKSPGVFRVTMSAARGQRVAGKKRKEEGGDCSVYVQGGIANPVLLASDSICCQLRPLNFLFHQDLFDSNRNSR